MLASPIPWAFMFQWDPIVNSKQLLDLLGLITCGPKQELVQRVRDHMAAIQRHLRLQVEEASMLEEDSHGESDEYMEDVVCEVCGNDGEELGNSIVLCDASHSALVGYHQLCCDPQLVEVPDGEWMCPKCCQSQLNGSSAGDPDYTLSSHATTSLGPGSSSQPSSKSSSSSTSESDSESDSDSSSGSSNASSDSSSLSSN